tara:strand:+ start:431 stop:616 length:186 start_codon:yes stop_codon:yes gene_type:complete
MAKETSKQVIKSIRLPESIWNILKVTSDKSYRTLNSQILKILEDWLVEHNYIDEDERFKND